MANILTAAEAANVLRCDATDPAMLDELPLVDIYLKHATGWDWAADSTIRSEAKAAARILLVRSHEDPGALNQPAQALGWGLQACIVQLQAIALHYKTFEGRDGAGYLYLPGAKEGDTITSLIGRVGITGDQSALFESVISKSGHILQLSDSDLTERWFTAYLTSPDEI